LFKPIVGRTGELCSSTYVCNACSIDRWIDDRILFQHGISCLLLPIRIYSGQHSHLVKNVSLCLRVGEAAATCCRPIGLLDLQDDD
jgi:hypothetical protein